jgi:hypothetical protein
MKHANRHQLALVPLLSILAMSPAAMEKTHGARFIASETVTVSAASSTPPTAQSPRTTEPSAASDATPAKPAKPTSAPAATASTTPSFNETPKPAASAAQKVAAASPHRRLLQLAEKVDRESLQRDANLTLEQFKEKSDELKAKLILERREFKKDEGNNEIVEGQRKKLESLVVDLLVVEAGHKKLKEKNELPPADDDASKKIIADSKDLLEDLLGDLEYNELLVDKGGQRREETVRTEPAQGRNVEVSLGRPPVRTGSDGAGTSEERLRREECETEERNRILTRQVEELSRQQTQIMQQMMSMQQMMMMQQQQNQMAQLQQYMFNGPGFNSSPYQYNQPVTAGNWVYYPSGFQPQQPNIFAQPQLVAQQGVFPDQMHQQMPMPRPQWALQSGPSFADSRYQASPMQTGSFGGDAFGYNFGPQMQPQMPVQAQVYGPQLPFAPQG